MDIKSTPKQALKKLVITIPVIVGVGLLLYFLDKKIEGIAMIVGGILGAIFGIFLVLKVKKESPQAAKKLFSLFYVIAGGILLFLALLVFFFENESISTPFYANVLMGIVLLIYGIYSLKKYNIQN